MMPEKNKKKSESFCMSPWTHTYISPQSERRLCCASREPAQNFKQYIDTAAGTGVYDPVPLSQWWNSEHLRSVRRRMIAGESLSECEVCNNKLLNTAVYRDYFNQLFGNLREQAIASTDADGYTTMSPISWDYRYSNVCNFKCRMCGDMLSSAWEIEVQRHDLWNKDNPKNHWMLPHNRQAIRKFVQNTVIPEFREAIEAKTVREIYWVGGEPLLYDEHWSFMRRIVELGYADQVRVRYNTNLSRVHDKQGSLWQLLENFPQWEICASLDGTGAIGEYIRSGLDYSSWLVNFTDCVAAQKRPRQARIDFTLTLPGLASVISIVDLANKLNVNLLSKVVFAFSPDIVISPLAMPRDVLVPWIEQIQLSIKEKINHNTQSMWDVLEHLKTRPTFAEEYPDYSDAAIRGKRHLLNLERIRSDVKITMEDILQEYEPALHWWRTIDE
jgi:uncharacterized protein with PIN domain